MTASILVYLQTLLNNKAMFNIGIDINNEFIPIALKILVFSL